MKNTGHSYRNGVRGRSVTTRPGVGGLTITAHLACARCPKVGDLNCRQMMPPDQIDQKFSQAGWALDPHTCPDCRAIPKEKTVASKPSQAAMKAQTQMFHALSAHFDPDAGRYATGWTDKRIAEETGLSPDVVSEFRRAGFGEIKEAPEIAALRADVVSLEQLSREHTAMVSAEIASLRGRIAKLSAGSPA